MRSYDVVIVGAGPAGIFAALELMGSHRIAILDAGRPLGKKRCPLMTIDKCTSCKPLCHVLGGFGGAQFFQGTKLSRYPAGEALLDFIDGVDRLEEMYDYLDGVLESHGKRPRPHPTPVQIGRLKKTFNELGLEFKYYNAQKVSQLEMNAIGNGLAEALLAGGVEFHEKQLVTGIQEIEGGFRVSTATEAFVGKNVVLALGRMGSRSMQRLSDGLGLQYEQSGPEEIEIGVRVETPYRVFDGIDGIHNDLKIKKSLGENGTVKTFCQEYRGYLTKCCFNLHGDSEFSTLDGYILGTDEVEPEKRSGLSNLGIHHKFKPGVGLRDAYEMVRNISSRQQPIFQSMRGFLGGCEDSRFDFKPSMPDARAADINKFLPAYSASVIKEFVHTIDKVLPGFGDGGNIVYAPSFELGAVKMKISSRFESSVAGVYVGGDATGHFRGSMQAMASGVVIGRSIKERLNANSEFGHAQPGEDRHCAVGLRA